MMGLKTKNRVHFLLFHILVIALGLVILLPLYLIVINSLKTRSEASVVDLSLPARLIFENYATVFDKADIPRAMLNGAIISFSTLIIVILVTSMAAFIVIRRTSKLSRFIYYLIVAGLIAPLAIIPAMKIMMTIHIMGTYAAIILVLSSVCTPFSFFLFTGFIKGIPRQLDESAIVDGCKPMRLFFQIIFPLLKPVVVTNIITTFMFCWNDFTYALYFLGKSSMWNMPMTVYAFMGFHTADWNLVCADLVLTILPVMIVYFFAQKYIVAGMTTGAVKG